MQFMGSARKMESPGKTLLTPTATAFLLLHRCIHKNRLTAGWAEASSAVRAGAEPNIRRRGASLARGQ